MKIINVLPPVIYNRLAAGEVVENPASIVKELLENSLDAQAKHLTVQISNGGIDEIVIIDDGEGVAESELPKVFLPHATSKIKTVEDIDQISSLGFRGEALASIASVAKVTFTSKPASQDYAVQINQDNEQQYTGGNNGTIVRVANLFYNTPARKKFLRSSNIEKNHVTQVIHEIIFAHPELNLRYYVDKELVLDYRGNGLADAINQMHKNIPFEKIYYNGYNNQLRFYNFLDFSRFLDFLNLEENDTIYENNDIFNFIRTYNNLQKDIELVGTANQRLKKIKQFMNICNN